MTRTEVLQSAIQLAREYDCKIYVGRNDRTTEPAHPIIHYTEEYEEGPYFCAGKEAFALIYRYAKPIGVLAPGETTIFWSDLEETATDLQEALAASKIASP